MQEKADDPLTNIRASLLELSRQFTSSESRKIIQTSLNELDTLAAGLQPTQDEIRLAALYRVSQTLSSSLELDEVLTQAMDAVIGLTRAERGFLVLLEGDGRNWILRAARNYDQETLRPQDMEISRTIVNTVLKCGESILTTDARSDPRFAESESVMFYSLRSIMCAPLLARGQVTGAIFVDSRIQTGLFRQADLDLLNAFAAQAAVAIENARLYTRTDQALAHRVQELETLVNFDQDINESLELQYVIETARRWLLRVSGANQVWFLLSQDASDPGTHQSVPAGYHDLNDPAVSEVLKAEKPQMRELAEIPTWQLMIPLLHTSTPLGVVVLEREDPFSDTEIQFIRHLCERAALVFENARLYQAVQEANLAKSQFVSVVSHELRVPMTSIKGYADLLRQGVIGPLNEMQLNFIDVIRSNVDRMSVLVSDLSDISRIESGRLKLELSEISLTDCLEESFQSLQPKLDEKHHSVKYKIPKDLPKLTTDPNRLVQVLTNIISNACKYTPPGGVIQVQAQSVGDELQIEVTDNGIGISLPDQARLFTQFFRSDDPVVREEQGWGLGLNVSRLLIDLMGGEMGVRSVPGQGSTFWFTLPCANCSKIPKGG